MSTTIIIIKIERLSTNEDQKSALFNEVVQKTVNRTIGFFNENQLLCEVIVCSTSILQEAHVRRNGTEQAISYRIYPIGYVRRGDNKTYLEIFQDYRPALQELHTFSHAQIVWWSHHFANDEYRQTKNFDPPFEAPTLGIFASRAPMRPNPIGISTIKMKNIDIDTGVIEIFKIDAYDGTPLLDIKGYMPFYDRVETVRVPDWASKWPRWMPDEGIDADQMP